MCTDDDKDRNSIMQGCDNIKLNRHMKDNHNGFTNHVLATLRLGFNLLTECEKPNDAIICATKSLMQIFSHIGSNMRIPCAVLYLDCGYWCWNIILLFNWIFMFGLGCN